MKRSHFLLHLLFILLAFSSFSVLINLISKPKTRPYPSLKNPNSRFLHPPLKVYVADLPRSFNYGLLSDLYSLSGHDNRLGTNPDADRFSSFFYRLFKTYLSVPPYPENPLIKPHAAEYWLLKHLEMNKNPAGGATAVRVRNLDEADVVFVPFFASLSAEMELGWGTKGKFRKKIAEKNGDYRRQREVVDRIKASAAWRRSGGRDHVFVMSDPVAMWHVRSEIAPAILLVEDFGGWYQADMKATVSGDACNSTYIIQHTEASLLKDVIVPYNHLIPRFHISQNQPRHTLLYFKGAKHRHRGGSIREKLWQLLENVPGVKMEEGSLNATGLEEAKRGMRDAEFCLHPAGDTPTSCRLFDAIASLCIPVIVSDQIELPFEGVLDYTEFAVFVSVKNALTPNWLMEHLRGFSEKKKEIFRVNLAGVQSYFEYEGGDAVSQIWEMVYQKLPMIRQGLVADRRKLDDRELKPVTCLCT
ncbi:Exostosin family protein [Rhynchospora pubera]|uniref:Exostosin family protein n=1 Tax=Rhynchospora pubera TaxID=906938 RepID=A0AAV8EGN4_9POAL|nr:Exostosin family protein [Rhynchospora pubera]